MACKVCGAEIEDKHFDQCWRCLTPLNIDENQAAEIRAKKVTKLKCVRCKRSLNYAGLKKFHEGSIGFEYWLGGFGELLRTKQHFDVYVCANCGKVEFFLDGVGETHRPEE